MMPSRGLQAIKGRVPRLQHCQSRNLSSIPRSRPAFFPRNALSSTGRLPVPGISLASKPILLIESIRHASTSTSTPPAPPPPEVLPNPSADASYFANLDTITLDGADLSTVTEKIGYLREIGLDYGWGPTSTIQWILEHIHVYSGLPWWGSIAATAVALRIILLPLFLRMSDQSARQMALNPILKPITQRMQKAQKAKDQMALMTSWAELRAVRARAGLKLRWTLIPILTQGVLGFCGFKLMRAMAALPVPALTTDGPLWIKDLTVTDPYLILPIAMAGSIHLLMRMGGESGAMDDSQMTPGMKKVMLYGVPSLIAFSTGWLPACVNVYFAAGGTLAICQSLLLRQPVVRNALGITPLYKINPASFMAPESAASQGSAKENWVQKMAESLQKQSSYQKPGPPYGGASHFQDGRTITVEPVKRRDGKSSAGPESFLEPASNSEPVSKPEARWQRPKINTSAGRASTRKRKQAPAGGRGGS